MEQEEEKTGFNPDEFLNGNQDKPTDEPKADPAPKVDDAEAPKEDAKVPADEEVENDEDQDDEDSWFDDEDEVGDEDAIVSDEDAPAAKEFWQEAASEAGIEAASVEEYVTKSKDVFAKVKELEQELERVKSQSAVSESGAVQRLSGFLKLNDEDLVKEHLKAKGLDGDDLEEAYREIDEAGDIDREARSIRLDIKVAIKDQIKNAEAYKAKEEAKLLQEQQEYFREVNQVLSKTDTFLGLKIGKNQNESEAIKSKAFAEYTSGKLFNDILSSKENVAEFIMLWTLRKNISGRIGNSAANREKRRLVIGELGQAQNHQSSRGGFNNAADNDKGFNPDKFLARD